MKRIISGVLKFLMVILLSVLTGCSAPIGNDASGQSQPAQPDPPIITVYKAPT